MSITITTDGWQPAVMAVTAEHRELFLGLGWDSSTEADADADGASFIRYTVELGVLHASEHRR